MHTCMVDKNDYLLNFANGASLHIYNVSDSARKINCHSKCK